MSKIYRTIINAADKYVPKKFRPLWEHDAGPKTIFFWAPAFKWSLVMAGLGDINRLAETLSFYQSTTLAITSIIWSRYLLVIVAKNYSLFSALVAASVDEYRRPLDKISTAQTATLSATGFIWTRYSLIIRPVNYALSLCNFSLGLANGVQCYRAYMFQRKMIKL